MNFALQRETEVTGIKAFRRAGHSRQDLGHFSAMQGVRAEAEATLSRQNPSASSEETSSWQ